MLLAGGGARRLGGCDKPGLAVGGRTLLEHALAAAAGAATTVVVGPRRATSRPVVWRREDPPGGGPVAALAAGLPAVDAPVVALLAADLPFLDRTAVEALVAAVGGHDGALLVDGDGRDQLLVGAWRVPALRGALAAVPGGPAGARLGPLLRPLDAVRLPLPPPPGALPAWFDCDTAADLAAARGRA